MIVVNGKHKKFVNEKVYLFDNNYKQLITKAINFRMFLGKSRVLVTAMKTWLTEN